MFSLPAFASPRSPLTASLLLSLLIIASIAVPAYAQGNGRAATGTGGKHMIQGKIFFPSGRRAEGTIQIKLQSLNSAEITALADSSGAFTFAALAPGNYTVIVNAGDQYELSRDTVTIDSDLNLSRSGVSVNTGTRRYTVMVTLRNKREQKSSARPGVINASLAEVPENARALYQKALDSVKTGDLQRAIEDLKIALSVYPKFPLALNELGVQYLRLGQAAKAVEPLKSASKLSPGAFSPHLNLGIALLETRQLADAESELREAIKINSTPTAHMYLGLTLITAKRFEEAQHELETAISTGGENLAQVHRYLGALYWRKHDYRRAVDEFETYLRLRPDAPDADRVREKITEWRAKS